VVAPPFAVLIEMGLMGLVGLLSKGEGFRQLRFGFTVGLLWVYY